MSESEKRARILAEIDHAKSRQVWIAKQVEQGENSAALSKFAFETEQEIDALLAELATLGGRT